MKKTMISAMLVFAVILMMQGNASVGAQDRNKMKALNGISFSEIRGYETWQVVAPSYRTDNNEVRIILGNTAMINAYND